MVLEVHRNLNAVCRINRERFRDAVLSGYGVTRSPDKITTDNPIQPITAITTVTSGANTATNTDTNTYRSTIINIQKPIYGKY